MAIRTTGPSGQCDNEPGAAEAALPELERLLPRDAAMAVYRHFHEKPAEPADSQAD